MFSTEGEAVAKVAEVVGDTDADIFTGLAISLRMLGQNRLVESERVRGIWPDRVELDLTREQIEALPSYDEPVAERLVPPDDFMTRLRRLLGFYGKRGPKS